MMTVMAKIVLIFMMIICSFFPSKYFVKENIRYVTH